MNSPQDPIDIVATEVPQEAAKPQPGEIAWLILLIGMLVGAVLFYFLWDQAMLGAVVVGIAGYFVGALIDRARR